MNLFVYMQVLNKCDAPHNMELNTMTKTFTVTDEQQMQLFNLVKSHNQAIKNWLASAVERDDLVDAKNLVTQLRQHERLFAMLNPLRLDD